MRPATLFVMLTSLLLVALPLRAQTCPNGQPFEIATGADDATQEITLAAGGRYLGRVLDPGDPVRFELLSGDVLEIARSRIVCLRTLTGSRQDGEFWPEDPNTTRLFFGPTGRALGRGEGYFSVVEVVMPFLSLGVTDRLTLSGGLPLVFTSAGPELIWLAPKLQVLETERFAASVGVLAFFAPGESENLGVLYTVGTWGETSDQAVTAGIGWGYDSSGGLHDTPALMLGGETRISRGAKLVTENYFFPAGDFAIVSAGPRFFGEKLTADLGLALPVMEDMEFFMFPVVNFAWNW